MSADQISGGWQRRRDWGLAPPAALKLAVSNFPSALMDELWIVSVSWVIVWDNFEDADAATMAVVLRHRAAYEASESYIKDRPPGGTPTTRPAWYQQERDLFSFFVNGHSCLESLAFLLNILASRVRPDAFPMTTPDDQRKVSLNTVTRRFQSEFNDEPLTAALTALVNSTNWKSWCEIRNSLIHRTTPVRRIRLAGLGDGDIPELFSRMYLVQAPPDPLHASGPLLRSQVDQWGEMELTETFATDYMAWLEVQLEQVLESAVPFFEAQANSLKDEAG